MLVYAASVTGAAYTSNIEWCTSIQYLGVYIVPGKCVSADINSVKFYAAFNCIFNQAGSIDEILQLTMQETYCLPVLLCAAPQSVD